MKKLALALGLVMVAGLAWAADGDIVQTEVIPDVAKWELDTVRLLAISRTAEIDYRKVDADGNPTGKMMRVLFTNTPDDPETPEDETNNEFTQLINYINSNSNIKTSIETAVKVKLGI